MLLLANQHSKITDISDIARFLSILLKACSCGEEPRDRDRHFLGLKPSHAFILCS